MLRIKEKHKRDFCVIECKKNNWSKRELERQIRPSLYDKLEKAPHENPPVGILVCEENDHAVVKFTLPENNQNIFAVEYKKYLPSEKEIQTKIQSLTKKL